MAPLHRGRPAGRDRPGVSFLTNHAHVLLAVARQPDMRVRDIAAHVGVTERSVQLILRDLADDGYVRIAKQGRRNRYHVARSGEGSSDTGLAVELARIFGD